MKKIILFLLLTFLINYVLAQQMAIVYFNPIDAKIKQAIAHSIEANYHYKTIEYNDVLPKTAHYAPTNRYKAYILLTYLASKYTNVIGVTTKDISDEENGKDWGVLGLGKYKTCVISTYRTKNNVQRIAKLAIHEVGHTALLKHCKTPKCVMGNGIKNLNLAIPGLCTKCKQLIKK